jgi:hypothetical protein
VLARVERLIDQMWANPAGVRHGDLAKVCDHYFGDPRQQGTSHRVYRMPWQGDPRVDIHDDHGKAKPCQVRQVLAAIHKLEGESS